MRTLILVLALVGCSENERAKHWGGDMTVDLPCDEMLFDLTWKEDSFWYATQPMPEDYEPRTTTFHEDPGAMKLTGGGTVTVNETRCSAEVE